MAYIPGIDVSQWQGNIDWSKVTSPIAIIKMSGGDDGLYFDSKANQNYYGAQAVGKAIGMYHFAGGNDPVNEADYFINACSPLAENDVLVLDWEIKHSNPVGWCETFVNRVHEKTGIWPLIYFNGSTWNAYDWTPVTKNCGVWVAWYDRDPNADLPVGGKVYVMHQYTSSGSMPGINGRVDLNAWFGTVEQFKKYGYKSSITPPGPVITTKEESITIAVPFTKETTEDPSMPKGDTKVIQQGVDGVRTETYIVTYTDGIETNRVLKSSSVTQEPVPEITAVGTKENETKPDVVSAGKTVLAVVLASIAAVCAYLLSLLKG